MSQEMRKKMAILKSVIVAELRHRGLDMRADFVDKQLPAEIDPAQHVGLLATLNLDAATLSAMADTEPPVVPA